MIVLQCVVCAYSFILCISLTSISEYLSDEEDQLFWEFVEGTRDFHWMYSTEQSVCSAGCVCARTRVR